MLHDVIQAGWAKYVLQQVSTMQSPSQTPLSHPKSPKEDQKYGRSQPSS